MTSKAGQVSFHRSDATTKVMRDEEPAVNQPSTARVLAPPEVARRTAIKSGRIEKNVAHKNLPTSVIWLDAFQQPTV
jgi:hypothetical protein